MIAIDLVVFRMPVAAGQSPSLDWTWQMEDGHAVGAVAPTADKMGNVVVFGSGQCAEPFRCDSMFITKISALGEKVWTYEEESFDGELSAVAANHLGDVFITGVTSGNLTGGKEVLAGARDLFVMCILANGTHSWTYQVEDRYFWPKGFARPYPRAIALDKAGDVIITGWVAFWGASVFPGGNPWGGDNFVVKLHEDGAWAWATYYSSDAGRGFHEITTDMDDNIFVAVSPVVNKFSPDGTLNLTWHLTTHTDSAGLADVMTTMCDKAGDAIILGKGPLHEGALVLKIHANGTQAWLTQISTIRPGYALAMDGESNIYIIGIGQRADVVVQVHADGSLGWTFDLGKPLSARFVSRDIAVHEQGDVFVGTLSDFVGELSGTFSRTYQVSKINTNMGAEESSTSSTLEPVNMSDTTVEVSSASRGAEAELMLAAVTGVLLAMILKT